MWQISPPSASSDGISGIRARADLRKRKRTHQQDSENPAKQQTLPTAFTDHPETDSNFDRSTGIKKHCGIISESSLSATELGTPVMYTFSSRLPTTNGNGTIDLTSPTASPQFRRVNGAAIGRPSINPHTGAKKLVVKNLKQNTNWDSKAYLEKIWSQLDNALSLIFEQNDGFSKEDLYRGVENVCRQGGAATLASRLQSRCKLHVVQDMTGPQLGKSDQGDETILKAVLAEWEKWKGQMITIRAIFFFLDRSYLLSSSKPTLSELTPLLFRENLFDDPALQTKIIDGACDLVTADRAERGRLEADLFQRVINMFHELSVYTSLFEPRFLASAQAYIATCSDELMSTKSLPDYVTAADEIIANEMSRCDSFALDGSTRRDLLNLLEHHLIQRKQTELTEYDPLKKMLDNNSTTVLTNLYALLNRRRLGNKLRPAFEKWVDQAGTSIVLSNDSEDMVVNLLSLKRSLDLIWQESFQRDESLGHGLRESFAIFINKTRKGQSTWGTDNTKVGEMIAKYVDQLLRGGAKAIPDVLTTRRTSAATAPKSALSNAPAAEEDNEDADVDEDEEVNIQLDQVLDLFRFLQGKAVFEAFYKKDLARRLLMGRSASADAEQSMLARLKTECGSGFTQNLEQMFKDVELAREEMHAYKQRLEERIGYEKGRNVDLSINILSAAAWPTYPDIPVIIPANVKKAIDDFELHYKSKHSGRKLDWKHALAHCQMRASFKSGTKELVVSSFQAIVLLLFNGLPEDSHLDYQHILSASGLPEPEVKRTLQSLACAKLRPLTKHPKGKEISDTDTFTVNTGFEHAKYRVKINQVQLKETKEENRETHERVQEDRNFETQAAIVRILKSRKTISHPELISEVIKATLSRGRLEVADIKKNIDRLIEKDYMEREEGNMYSYVA